MQFEINLTQQGQDAKVEVIHTCTLEIDFLASVPTLGLSLTQGKSILKELQAAVVVKQIEQLAAGERICKHCGRARNLKDYHDIHYRSLFGDVVCRMPRCVRMRSCRRMPCSKKTPALVFGRDG